MPRGGARSSKTPSMKLKLYLLLPSLLCVSLMSPAQDIHFTMYDMAPLSLNPAHTGAYEGTFRIGGIYRDQWASIMPNQFTTPMFYLDAPVLMVGKRNWVGVGMMMYQDKAGVARLRNGTVQFSGAFHLALDKKSDYVLTLGLQGGMVQRDFDITSPEVLLGDELLAGTPGASPDRTVQEPRANYLDMATGVMFRARMNDETTFTAGIAAHHINKPKYSLLQQNSKAITQPLRLNGHMRVDYQYNELLTLSPTLLFQNMAGTNEIILQGWGKYLIKKEQDLSLIGGLGYRLADAAMVIVGAQYQDWKVALSYDINTSSLRRASNYRGGFEIALGYIGRIYKKPDVKPAIICPRL
ncbi:MAG: type IX secretion system membrane protein PorP/SprF [Bacteroidetes bacterium]|nr:MAG: type IX secretion system membrane protein PorP/SprF [Bacteroidota bacterium]